MVTDEELIDAVKAGDAERVAALVTDEPDRLRECLGDVPSRAGSRSADGYTALHFAALFAKPEAARILLEAGVPVDVVADNEMRVQPLHSAAAQNGDPPPQRVRTSSARGSARGPRRGRPSRRPAARSGRR